MAGKYSLSVEQGDTFNFQFQIRNKETGVGWNLTGYTVQMQIKSFANAGVSLLDINSNDDTIDIDNNGNVNITINNTITDNLPLGRLSYEIIFISPGNVVSTELEGSFTVKA